MVGNAPRRTASSISATASSSRVRSAGRSFPKRDANVLALAVDLEPEKHEFAEREGRDERGRGVRRERVHAPAHPRPKYPGSHAHVPVVSSQVPRPPHSGAGHGADDDALARSANATAPRPDASLCTATYHRRGFPSASSSPGRRSRSIAFVVFATGKRSRLIAAATDVTSRAARPTRPTNGPPRARGSARRPRRSCGSVREPRRVRFPARESVLLPVGVGRVEIILASRDGARD